MIYKNMKSSWQEVTIGDYQEIVNIVAETEVDKAVQLVSILSDRDSDEIRKAPLNDFYKWMEDIKFASTTPDADVNKTFEIDGVRYGLIPDLNFISTGEWLDAENWKEKSIDNLHNYAALLFRPVTRYVDDTDYEIEEHKTIGFVRRSELFRDRVSINKVYGAQIFFSLFGLEFFGTLAGSLMNQLREEIMTNMTPMADMKTKTTQPPSKKNKKKASKKRGRGMTS